MRTRTIIIVAAVALLWPHSILAADKKPQDLIVGKWLSADEKNKGTSIEFTSDGLLKFNFSADGMSFVFTHAYKFADDKTLEITVDKKTEKFPIKSLTHDEFVFVDGKGSERSLKREKLPAPELPKKGGFNENLRDG